MSEPRVSASVHSVERPRTLGRPRTQDGRPRPDPPAVSIEVDYARDDEDAAVDEIRLLADRMVRKLRREE